MRDEKVVAFVKIVNMYTLAVKQFSFLIDSLVCIREEEENWEQIFGFALH